MSLQTPRKGPGAFQWNAGGWFGAQIGSTLWLLILGLVFIGQTKAEAGLSSLLAWAIANAVGLYLWSRRSSLAPFVAIEILLAVMGLSTLGAFLLIEHFNELAGIDARFSSDPGKLYWLLALYPGLMVMFASQERAMRRNPR